MRRRYLRVPPQREHEVTAAVVAGAAATCVGLATFYFVRLMLSREPMATTAPALPGRTEAEE